ncbi:hypothetical protein QWJ26_20555 [Streptomyces sp. CSDS2]|uniref:hypothetical protein n=1 Tax=Streptomyces sp. CSDS2 TaxID=3055051 RepID=UPI0025B109BC|nr:hypothetical protein [Streptomyces sp. CSDS2]MDN3262161.1 hypothetical protein [Streptomyces sp. CSDS2]
MSPPSSDARRTAGDRSLWCLPGAIGSARVLVLGGTGGTAGPVVPAGGMLLLAVAVRGGQVAHRARDFAPRPDARAPRQHRLRSRLPVVPGP